MKLYKMESFKQYFLHLFILVATLGRTWPFADKVSYVGFDRFAISTFKKDKILENRFARLRRQNHM